MIEEDGAKTGEGCHLFRRWGRIGEECSGDISRKMIIKRMHRLDAMEAFEEVFLEKTGNPWESWARHKAAVKLPGKYYPVEQARPCSIECSTERMGLKCDLNCSHFLPATSKAECERDM